MRICMIGNATAVHLQRWAAAYIELGHTVDVVSIRSADIPGARVHTTSVGPPNGPHALWTLLSYLRLGLIVRRVVRALDPDVVNPHFVTTSGTFARLAGVHPIVLTAWGSDLIPADGVRKRWPVRFLNRWALRGADRVTAASHYLAAWVERGGGPAVDLVRFGVETDRFAPAEPAHDEGSFHIGVVKALQDKYGIRHLVEAFAIVRGSRPNARLIIAGAGPERPNLEALAACLGVAHEVTFLGSVPHRDVPAVMRRLDVLVNPTIVPEAFGVVVLEGSASGLPVVATDVGGVPEVCIDGVTGVLVPARNPAAIAAAVTALADDPALRTSLGERGRALVESTFDWRESVASMMRVIESAREAS